MEGPGIFIIFTYIGGGFTGQCILARTWSVWRMVEGDSVGVLGGGPGLEVRPNRGPGATSQSIIRL